MNIHKKTILILGFNQAIGHNLVQRLIDNQAYVIVADIDNHNHYSKIFSSISLGKVIELNDSQIVEYINNSDIIINLLTCPTPYNLSTKISQKCCFLDSFLKQGLFQEKYLVSFVPAAKDIKLSSTIRTINPLIDKLKDLPQSMIININTILSKKDSLLLDIYNCIYIYKKTPSFSEDNEIFYISSENLSELVLKAIDLDLFNKQIQACNKFTIKLNSLVKKSIAYCDIDHTIGNLPSYYIKTINLLGSNKLLALSENYLNTILYNSVTASEAIKATSLLQIHGIEAIFSMYFLNNHYTNVDFRNEME